MIKKILAFLILLLSPVALTCEIMTLEKGQQIVSQSHKLKKVIVHAAKDNEKRNYFDCMQQIDKAIDVTKKEIENTKHKNEFISFLHAWKAECKYLLRDYNNAITDSNQALFYDQENGYAYYVKAYSFFALGQQRMAITCLRLSANLGCIQAQEEIIAYKL